MIDPSTVCETQSKFRRHHQSDQTPERKKNGVKRGLEHLTKRSHPPQQRMEVETGTQSKLVHFCPEKFLHAEPLRSARRPGWGGEKKEAELRVKEKESVSRRRKRRRRRAGGEREQSSVRATRI
ncbi:hypothetical protein Q8A73_023255 [Channa argus]|nr:hypothetical protein Q8A73_023255 [Channa argus]